MLNCTIHMKSLDLSKGRNYALYIVRVGDAAEMPWWRCSDQSGVLRVAVARMRICVGCTDNSGRPLETSF